MGGAWPGRAGSAGAAAAAQVSAGGTGNGGALGGGGGDQGPQERQQRSDIMSPAAPWRCASLAAAPGVLARGSGVGARVRRGLRGWQGVCPPCLAPACVAVPFAANSNYSSDSFDKQCSYKKTTFALGILRLDDLRR